MSPPDVFQEPLGHFVARKYLELVFAGLIFLMVLTIDAAAFATGIGTSAAALSVVNLLVISVAAALTLMSRRKLGMRRYVAKGEIVTLPVSSISGTSIPLALHIENVVGVSLAPAAPPLRNTPAEIRLAVVIDEPAPESPRRRILKLSMMVRDFGMANLRDLAMRLPEGKLEPGFSRTWRQGLRMVS